MKIVLIVADTFRYDYLAPDKTVWVDTPELDQLREDSVWFENTYAGSFPTAPHRYDLLTGRYRFPFGWWGPLEPNEISLAEILMDYGYVTQLITDTGNIIGRGMNYDRGFLGYYLVRGQERDISFTKMNQPMKSVMPVEKTKEFFYFGNVPQVDLAHWINSHWQREEDRFTPQVARHAANWIEDNYSCKDFLLYLDFFDPHEPWDPPEFYVKKYQPKYSGTPMLHPNYGLAEIYSQEELENFRARYKGEVEMVSKWVGRVLRQMKDVGIYEDSLIIFTSDHGILIGEHNCVGKAGVAKSDTRGPWPLYQELIHVPLMVKLPGNQNAGRIIEDLVQPVDILPTVLELTGIRLSDPLPGKAAPPDREIIHFGMDGIIRGRNHGLNPIHGCSLLKAINKEGWPREAAFSTMHLGPLVKKIILSSGAQTDQGEVLNWTSVIGRNHTFMLGGRPEDKPRLYDIKTDPLQGNNIYTPSHPISAWLTDHLFKFLESVGADKGHIDLLKNRIT